MLKILITFLMIAVVFVLLYWHLLKQSKHPSGLSGRLMMKVWNKTYLPMVKWAITADLPRKTNQIILDVGVGNGESTLYLEKEFPEATLYGIDISVEGIEQARKKTANSYFQIKNVEDTNFDRELFDLIFAFQTHFHWDDLTKSLLELKRVMKANGTLVIVAEKTKTDYFLPDLAKSGSFNKYLLDLGLTLVQQKDNQTWLAYYIKKKVA